MNNIPNPEYPQQSNENIHQQHVSTLESLKEPWGSKGCKIPLQNYLNWLFTKTLSYERDTQAWERVASGSVIRTGEEYIQDRIRKLNAIQVEASQRLSQTEDRIGKTISASEQMLNTLQHQIQQAQAQLDGLNDTVNLMEGGFYEYSNPAEVSVRFKNELDVIKDNVKNMQRTKTAILTVEGFTFNNSVTQGKKFTKDFSTLMLTAYNQEVENTIVKLEKTRELSTAIARVEKAADRVEKLGTMLSMKISPSYHNLRVQEIEIAFKFKEAEIQRKEKEQEERERLREEEKLRKEAEKAIAEAEAAEKAKRAELDRLLSYQQQHYANVAGALPPADPRIAELEAQIAELEKAKEKASSALLNTKAGYVYVISNIGSFGEGIVKIGLTRRLVPDDRVKELSSASVPFIFDTHAIHFSQNAVELENKLHKHFHDRRVNKVNERKEFFRVSLKEVKDALVLFSGNGATLQFDEKALASDYRRSIGQKP